MRRPVNPTFPRFRLEKSPLATATVSLCPNCVPLSRRFVLPRPPPARFITAHDDSRCNRPDATPDFCLLLSHRFPFSRLFDERRGRRAFPPRSFLLCRFQSVAAGQEMCWWNASKMCLQYVLLTLLSAGKCGDIGLGWGRGRADKIDTIF